MKKKTETDSSAKKGVESDCDGGRKYETGGESYTCPNSESRDTPEKARMRTAVGPLNATDQSIRTSVTNGPCLVVVIRAAVAVRRAKVSFRLDTFLGDVSLQKLN